jgi:hypothetical protein
MAARLKARPDILDRRRETVEHPFGSIKQWMNQGAFLMKGLESVRAEFSLSALAYNLRRAINLPGVTDNGGSCPGLTTRVSGPTGPLGSRSAPSQTPSRPRAAMPTRKPKVAHFADRQLVRQRSRQLSTRSA